MKSESTRPVSYEMLPRSRRGIVTAQLVCAGLLILLIPVILKSITYALNDMAIYAGGGYGLIRNQKTVAEAILPCILPILLDAAIVSLSVIAFVMLHRDASSRMPAVLYGVTALLTVVLIVCVAVLWKQPEGTIPNPFRLAEFIPFRYDLTPDNDFGAFLRKLIGGSVKTGWVRLYAYKYIPLIGTLVLSALGGILLLRRKPAEA